MRKNRNPFFVLLNIAPDKNKRTNDIRYIHHSKRINQPEDNTNENEWMQEYHIIYNSYILDGKESDLINN